MRIKTPKVTLNHIQSNFCDVANIRIKSTDKQALFDSGMDDEEKWEITNKWKITYTPYCGGRHRLTIKVEDVLTHVKEITVRGRPPVGSTVMCGPDSHSTVEGTVAGADPGFGKGGFYRYKNARGARAKFWPHPLWDRPRLLLIKPRRFKTR